MSTDIPPRGLTRKPLGSPCGMDSHVSKPASTMQFTRASNASGSTCEPETILLSLNSCRPQDKLNTTVLKITHNKQKSARRGWRKNIHPVASGGRRAVPPSQRAETNRSPEELEDTFSLTYVRTNLVRFFYIIIIIIITCPRSSWGSVLWKRAAEPQSSLDPSWQWLREAWYSVSAHVSRVSRTYLALSRG